MKKRANAVVKYGALAGVAAVALGALALDWVRQQVPEAAPQTPPAPSALLRPIKAPVVTFDTLDGRRIGDWQRFGQPVVLVHFWASWCAPCLVELPKIIAFAEKHPQVALVLVSTDDSRAAADRLWQRYKGAGGLWVWDAGKRLSLAMQALGVPETVVLDRDRLMIDKIVGEGPWASEPAWLNQ